MKHPKITIFTISYNGSQYIEDCFISIKNQTYKNWEWLFIDDGSEDNTQSIIEQLKDIYPIKYYRLKENSGRGKARNFGLNKVKTKYMVLLDIDDLMTSNRLEEYYHSIIKGYDAFVSASYVVSKRNSITGIRPVTYNRRFNLFTHATICIKSEILKKIQYADYRYAEDQRIISIIRKNKSVFKCTKPLYIYREEESISLKGAIKSNYFAFLVNLGLLRFDFNLNDFIYTFSFLLKFIVLKILFILTKNPENIYKKLISKRKKEKIDISYTLEDVLHGITE